MFLSLKHLPLLLGCLEYILRTGQVVGVQDIRVLQQVLLQLIFGRLNRHFDWHVGWSPQLLVVVLLLVY